MSPTAAPTTTRLGYHELPIDALVAWPKNPRRHASATADAELADSVRQMGILEPVIARPIDDADEDRYQVIAGNRRLAAARTAGQLLVPTVIRELTDAEALEIAVVENDQRSDVHPLDEAEAFAKLMTMVGYTPISLAQKLGRPLRYVTDRLRLHVCLTKETAKAFSADEISLGHALVLARLTPEQQVRGLEACFREEFNYEDEGTVRILAPVRRLEEWISEHVRLDVTSADTQEQFPELVAELAKVEAAGATVLALSDTWDRPHGQKPADGDPLYRRRFEEVKRTTKGAQLGVFVEGRRRGKTTWIVLKEEPKAVAPASSRGTAAPAKSEKQQAANQKHRQQQAEANANAAMEDEAFRRALIQIATLPPTLTDAPALRLVAKTLAGTDNFEDGTLDAVAAAMKLDPVVFEFSGDQARLKLSVPQLLGVIAVLAIGGDYGSEEAFRAFGGSVKAIAKELQKAEAAKAKRTTPPAPVEIAVSTARLNEIHDGPGRDNGMVLSYERNSHLKALMTHDGVQYAVVGSVSSGEKGVLSVMAHRAYVRSAWPFTKVKPLTYAQSLTIRSDVDEPAGYFGMRAPCKGVEYVLGEEVTFVRATAKPAKPAAPAKAPAKAKKG